MRKKLLIIDKCDDCPYFDNEYYTYVRECRKLDRYIPSVSRVGMSFTSPIPDDCPLEDEGECEDETPNN